MLLAAFVSSKCWAAEAASELLHASCCQTQAYAGHGTARISFRPPNTIFWFVVRDQVSASRKKYDTPASAMRLRYSTVWNVGEMTLEINLYELTAPFECCVLETEQMEIGEIL
jgi:hypothetical protein